MTVRVKILTDRSTLGEPGQIRRLDDDHARRLIKAGDVTPAPVAKKTSSEGDDGDASTD